jgi:hypothetical protein
VISLYHSLLDVVNRAHQDKFSKLVVPRSRTYGVAELRLMIEKTVS